MCYKIIIVDDEPPFIRMLEKKLLEVTNELTIVATANNGIEAMEKIKLYQPDIVISDIRMPVMDGLELANQVKALFPDVVILLVSSYRDFEYAKTALTLGVKDYLLKPIDSRNLNEVMNSMIINLEKLRRAKTEKVFTQMIMNNQTDELEVLKNMEMNQYFLVVVKVGYCSHVQSVNDEVMYLEQLLLETIEYMYRDINVSFISFGKDNREVTLVIENQNIDVSYLKFIIFNLAKALREKLNFYTTIVYDTNPITCQLLYKIHKNLRSTMVDQLIIGLDQQIDCDDQTIHRKKDFAMDPVIEKNNNLMLQTMNSQAIKRTLIDLFEAWEQNNFPLYYVEVYLKQMLMKVDKLEGKQANANFIDLTRQLDEVIIYANSYGELLNGYWDILSELFENKSCKDFKSVEELVDKIEVYVQQNLANDLSLQQIGAVFGASQAYISRSFRSYKNYSYNEYVIQQRIRYAKNLLEGDSTLLIKDIAAWVGYNDHHYFSRIFKKVVGESPTEYQSRK